MSDSENTGEQANSPEPGLTVAHRKQMKDAGQIEYLDRNEALKIARQIFVTNADLFGKLAEFERNENS